MRREICRFGGVNMQIQQPKKGRNGRYRFEDEIKINNTDALSKFEED